LGLLDFLILSLYFRLIRQSVDWCRFVAIASFRLILQPVDWYRFVAIASFRLIHQSVD